MLAAPQAERFDIAHLAALEVAAGDDADEAVENFAPRLVNRVAGLRKTGSAPAAMSVP